MQKFAAIGLFGRANAGKSTLINAMVGEQVSIVSNKPQTTRKRILGILTHKQTQLVFCDTPGLHQIKNKLDAFMHSEIMATLKGLQAGLYLVDLSDQRPDEDRSYLEQMRSEEEFPLFLVLNKSDLVEEADVEKAKQKYQEFFDFSGIFTVAARRGKTLNSLRDQLIKIAPEGPHAYDADYYTSLSEREIVEETIREVALESYYQEVPHSIAVQVEQFKERENGKTFVEANIFVERDSHKRIVVGKSGEGIRNLGKESRERLNRLLGRDIFLQLWVKVRENWRRSEEWIQRLGYRQE
ncbi:MAG: GTPase Era [Candidatus Rifleibacteriota bacterium]